MDISKLPPPTDPKAEYISKGIEKSCRSNRYTEAELRYNVAVGTARRARGEEAPQAPTPLRNSFTKIFEILQ